MALIREACLSDAQGISMLLDSLGYKGTESFIENRITQLLASASERLLVAVNNESVVGVISIHFMPQLALQGDFCRISYFCVSEQHRGCGIGAELEFYAVNLANERNCDRIELHCHSRRFNAHRFYEKQGYVESPKYLIKPLV